MNNVNQPSIFNKMNYFIILIVYYTIIIIDTALDVILSTLALHAQMPGIKLCTRIICMHDVPDRRILSNVD